MSSSPVLLVRGKFMILRKRKTIFNKIHFRIPTSTTAELDDFPAVNRESLDRVPFVEITNSGDPTIGFNPNREAFELWNRINEQIDELKRHGCNDKANGYSNV